MLIRFVKSRKNVRKTGHDNQKKWRSNAQWRNRTESESRRLQIHATVGRDYLVSSSRHNWNLCQYCCVWYWWWLWWRCFRCFVKICGSQKKIFSQFEMNSLIKFPLISVNESIFFFSTEMFWNCVCVCVFAVHLYTRMHVCMRIYLYTYTILMNYTMFDTFFNFYMRTNPMPIDISAEIVCLKI